MYNSTVFKWQEKWNLLVTRKVTDGRQITVAHYILPDDWTEEDCWEYGDAAIEEFGRVGSFPIAHRVVG